MTSLAADARDRLAANADKVLSAAVAAAIAGLGPSAWRSPQLGLVIRDRLRHDRGVLAHADTVDSQLSSAVSSVRRASSHAVTAASGSP